MYKYEVILYWSEDGNAFIAEAPEPAGCCADGETQREALDNLDAVIGEWNETVNLMGREIPKPKGRLKFA